MKTFLELDDHVFDGLVAHLLPYQGNQEQAAFLFGKCERTKHRANFTVVEARKLGPNEFAVQGAHYIELKDSARATLIKRAHDLEASLIEVHTHIGPRPAEFSSSDIIGLGETVPHMWWRLRGRPYLALVFTKSGFDALVWLDSPKVPRALDALLVGAKIIRPTNLSIDLCA